MGKAFEVTEALIDLVMGQLLYPFGAKLFHVERRHHRSEDHGPTQSAGIELFLTREITHQAACKSVTGACRIKDCFQRIRRNREVLVFSEHGRAVFSSLDDQGVGPPREDLASGFYQIRLV